MSTPAEAPAKKKRRLLPVILAVAVALSAGAATALTPGSPLRTAMGGTPADSTAAEVPFGEFVEMESIVINPRGTDGRRYLMARIGVEAAEPKTLERLGVLGPAVRDAVLETLSQRTVAELSDVTRRDTLKEEVRSALNRVLGPDGLVTRVYFTQYVLQ